MIEDLYNVKKENESLSKDNDKLEGQRKNIKKENEKFKNKTLFKEQKNNEEIIKEKWF